MCWLSWNLGASTSWNHLGLSGPVMGLLYLLHIVCLQRLLKLPLTLWSLYLHCRDIRKMNMTVCNAMNFATIRANCAKSQRQKQTRKPMASSYSIHLQRPPADAELLLGCLVQTCPLLVRFIQHRHSKLSLTLNPLTRKIWWSPNIASKWQMGFNSAFKALKQISTCPSNCTTAEVALWEWEDVAASVQRNCSDVARLLEKFLSPEHKFPYRCVGQRGYEEVSTATFVSSSAPAASVCLWINISVHWQGVWGTAISVLTSGPVVYGGA
jgi:hypothetical protein